MADLADARLVADLTLACAAQSAGVARREVARALAPLVDGDTLDTAVLLVSELVTNALLHARSDIRLIVRCDAEAVRIEVHDSTDQVPRQRHYRADAATGRGLSLVDSLAARWGTESTTAGKSVWFEVRPAAG